MRFLECKVRIEVESTGIELPPARAIVDLACVGHFYESNDPPGTVALFDASGQFMFIVDKTYEQFKNVFLKYKEWKLNGN